MRFKFIFLQSLVVGIKGALPLATFYIFSQLLDVNELASVLVIISLANLIANISNLSSNTLAPVYFFKGSKKNIAYFQFVRLILGAGLTLIATIYILGFSELKYTHAISIILYQLALSILPTWIFYSKGKIVPVLLIELCSRFPIFVSLFLALIYSNELFIYYTYSIVSLSIILFNFYHFVIRERILVSTSKEEVIHAIQYVKSVFPYNFSFCSVNSGLIFFTSIFLSDNNIVQLAFIDRVKALITQLQGVFYMERVSENNKSTTNNLNLGDFLRKNLSVINVCILSYLAIMISLTCFGGVVSYYFSEYNYSYLLLYSLMLLSAPANGINALVLNQYMIPKYGVNILFRLTYVILFSVCISAITYFISNEERVLMVVPLIIESIFFAYLMKFFMKKEMR